MGLWFLCTILFTIFSGLYFVYSPERNSVTEFQRMDVGGIFNFCRQAAVQNAIFYPSLGNPSPALLDCTSSPLPGAKLTAAGIPGLNVPTIGVFVGRTTQYSPPSIKRLVVTYVTPGTAVLGVPFEETLRQIRDIDSKDAGVGIVTTVGGIPQFQNGAAAMFPQAFLIEIQTNFAAANPSGGSFPDGTIVSMTVID